MSKFQFTKKEIEDYLRNEIVWQDCKIKETMLMYHNRKLNSYYRKPESFQQIKSLLKLSENYSEIFVGETGMNVFNRLVEVLTRNLGYNFYKELVKKLLSRDFRDDRDIFKLIRNKLIRNEYRFKFLEKRECSNKAILIDQIFWRTPKSIKDLEGQYNYLDIGFGDGGKTELLTEKFNIDISNVYGIESVRDFDEETDWRKDIKFKYSIIDEDQPYPYPDNFFSLTTALMSFHHVKNLGHTLEELNRVMVIGGCFILEEHDNFSVIDNMIADLEHTWWITKNSSKKGKKLDFSIIDNNNYYSWFEWDLILKKYGFEYIYSSQVRLSVKDVNRAARPYIFYFKKVEDI